MSNELNNLFNATKNQESTTNARSLPGTAQLTNMSTAIANEVLKVANYNFEDFKDLVAKSKTDNNAMDQLIAKAYDLTTVDIDFFTQLNESTLDSMLKSQQSKRSRSKSKVMTMDNYRSMMTGAIAEKLLRLATGKEKSISSSRSAIGSVEYTTEELDVLQNDQEKLRKEIRNVQSKKSIMKSKENFSELDERWLALLRAEEQLKSLRIDIKTVIEMVTIDETKNALTDVFAGVDPTTLKTMKSTDAKALLERAMALIAGKQSKEEDVTHE